MKVIVAGGTGFIGRALVRALQLRGDRVVVLTRSAARADGLFPPGVEAVEWHPPRSGPWMEAFNGADAVVNLSGELVVEPLKPWTEARRAEIRASRVDSTRAVVEAIKGAEPRPGVLVNQSAIGYYGSQGDIVLTEESPPGSDFLAGVVKDWEAAAAPVEEIGVRLVILRTGIVLGTDGGMLPQLVLPFKFYAGGTMGDPGQWFSWIHLEDEVELIIYALTHDGVRGAVNATAPNPVTMKVFSQEIGAALSRPSWVPFVGLGMRVALGRRAEAALASQRVLPAAAEAAGYMFRHAQSGEALRSLLGTHMAPGGGSL